MAAAPIRTTPTLVALSVTALMGCKAPPEAPKELEELAAFLFDHAADEDPEALEVGVANLDAWLSTRVDEAREGYTVSRLSADAIEGVGVDSSLSDGLVGAAVATTLPKGTRKVTRALVSADPTQVYPDTYTTYDSGAFYGAPSIPPRLEDEHGGPHAADPDARGLAHPGAVGSAASATVHTLATDAEAGDAAASPTDDDAR